jgi:hypothetical protein
MAAITDERQALILPCLDPPRRPAAADLSLAYAVQWLVGRQLIIVEQQLPRTRSRLDGTGRYESVRLPHRQVKPLAQVPTTCWRTSSSMRL